MGFSMSHCDGIPQLNSVVLTCGETESVQSSQEYFSFRKCSEAAVSSRLEEVVWGT